MDYKNPVLPGFYSDPSVCRVKDTYFLVTSTFQWFPGVPIFKSDDLINWKQIGFCLDRESQLDLKNTKSSCGIFAPTIRYHQNRFYMITTDFDGQGNFYVWTENPAGPWSDPIKVDLPGIDPSLYFEEDKVMVQTTGVGKGIVQAELDIKTGACGPGNVIWQGTGGRYPEAPHLYKIDKFYYLMLAEGGTEYGHMITIARSKSPWGPFESCPDNPILTHRNTEQHPIQGTGHGELVQDNTGRWWIVCLGFRPVNGYYHHLGRETFLAPVEWSKDKWPIINNNRPLEIDMSVDGKFVEQNVVSKWTDNFDKALLDLKWQFLRNPIPNSWSLTENTGCLTLDRLEKSRYEQVRPVILAVRQAHFNVDIETRLNILESHFESEAGLIVYMDEHHQARLFYDEGIKSYKCCVIIGDIIHETGRLQLEDEQAVLCIAARTDCYYFFIKDSKQVVYELGYLDTRYLSSEVAGGYTGVMTGVYCLGAKVCFDWFGYEPVEGY